MRDLMFEAFQRGRTGTRQPQRHLAPGLRSLRPKLPCGVMKPVIALG
jgi:hypothetical protein